MTVLVVDDDAGIREILRRLLLRDFGATVVEAGDGLKALQQLLVDRVDLVILDLAMPGMSGIETLEAIRRSPSYVNLPVIVLSGQSDEPRVIQASRLGILGFLAKPFTIASLRQRLSPLISKVRLAAGPNKGQQTLLELSPAHRVLIVDRQPEFRAFFRERLAETCQVDEADDEATAAKLCVDVPHEAVFIGTTAAPVHGSALRDMLNRGRRERAPRLIGVVPSADLEATRHQGTYDHVIVRSFVADTFDWTLRRIVTETTRARLLFSGSSPSAMALFAAAREKTESLLPEAVTLEVMQPFPESADRWVSAAVELHSASLAWEVRAVTPFVAALDLSSAWLDLQHDQVSEAQVLQVAGRLATELAGGLRAYARERDVDSTVCAPRVILTSADVLARAESARLGAGRRLVTPRHQPALVVQLAPLAARHA